MVTTLDGYSETDYRPRRKNTKRWCKGVVGREHVMVESKQYEFWRNTWYIEKCTRCGRHGKMRSEKTP